LPGSPCIGSGRYGRDRGALPYVPSSIDNISALPNEFTVINTYPNPFNSSTRIKFSLTNPAPVEIDIFNLIGQKVQSIYSSQLTSGRQSIIFKPDKNLSSGTYIIRLSVDNIDTYKKIAYVK
jgi:hypothetical protein